MYVIATVDKSFTKDQIRAEARKNGQIVQMIRDADTEWEVRLADLPPFMKKDEESEEAPKDAPEDAPKDDDSDDEPKAEKKDDDSKGEKSEKGESKGDSLGELKSLIQELQSQVEKVVSVAESVSADAESKQQKMEEIHDSVKDHVDGNKDKGELGDVPAPPVPGDAAGLEDVPAGPPMGGPPAGGPPKPPGAPKAPGAPGGRGAPGGKPQRPVRPPSGVPVFTKNQSEVIKHDGVDADGNRISLVAAAAAIEADEEWSDYEVTGMTENRDGTFSARLTLKSE